MLKQYLNTYSYLSASISLWTRLCIAWVQSPIPPEITSSLEVLGCCVSNGCPESTLAHKALLGPGPFGLGSTFESSFALCLSWPFNFPLSVKVAEYTVLSQSPQTSETKMLVKYFLFMGLRPSHSALYMLNKVYIDFAKTWPEPKRSLVVSKMEFPNQRPNFSGNASGAVVQRVEELSGGTDCRVTAAQKLPGKTVLRETGHLKSKEWNVSQ